jgi:hypothetical protein
VAGHRRRTLGHRAGDQLRGRVPPLGLTGGRLPGMRRGAAAQGRFIRAAAGRW